MTRPPIEYDNQQEQESGKTNKIRQGTRARHNTIKRGGDGGKGKKKKKKKKLNRRGEGKEERRRKRKKKGLRPVSRSWT
jgi:hypothetical protein